MRTSSLPSVVALLGLASCSALSVDAERAPGFQPTVAAPVRVVVLPFVDATGGTSPLLYPFLPLIWLADLVTLQVPAGTPDSTKGAETLQALIIARLRGSALNVLDPATVGTTLYHAGLIDKAATMDPRELGPLLGADAILYGTLDTWSGHYYLLESRTVVEGTVRLRSCMDGSDLFRARVKVSDAAGLSGGPTGYVSAVAAPLAALGTGPYRKLAVEWVEALGRELTGEMPAGGAHAAPCPYVANVAAAPAPERGYQPGDVIEVLAIGAPDCRATFDIGTLRVRIPMVEYARGSRTGVPDPRQSSGFYIGSYVVTPADRVLEAPVTVTLQSAGGRATAPAPGLLVTIRASAAAVASR